MTRIVMIYSDKEELATKTERQEGTRRNIH